MSIKNKNLKQISLAALVSLGACGVSNHSQLPNTDAAFSDSIVGGTEVDASDIVAQSIVAIVMETTEGQAICTGTIVDDDIVMTAAHCMPKEGGKMVVVFGRNITGDQKDYIVRPAIAYKANEEYDSKSEIDTHDVAIVKFDGALPAGYKKVGFVPSQSDLKPHTKIVLAGYGITDGTIKEGAGVLRKVETEILNPSFSNSEVEVDQSTGKGACHGDSGGPAFLEVNGKLLVWGITSRGEDSCVTTSIYTDALNYEAWIKKTAKSFKSSSKAI